MTFYENSKYLAVNTASDYDKFLPEYYFFDDESKKYIEETEFIQQTIGDRKYSSTLELGVGTGRVTKYLGPLSDEYKGIDISQSMISRITKKLPDSKYSFVVQDINSFIDNNSEELNKYDFVGSFWAFNYSILSFFEYTNFETGEVHPYQDLKSAEESAIQQVIKLFSNLKSGTEFLFFYFDAYSVEQSYVTRILQKELPFPYYDRGYTFKVFQKALNSLKTINYKCIYKNGYVELKNTEHLINYFSSLHLKGKLNTEEEKLLLVDSFKVYQYEDGHYEIPAGMNIISGKIK
ncbi:methyltransferase domain-containing protein [Exiguobacterium alkaliphilum]|uniref:methyltransferase domain-containing protein n=1 Tax=Exiguobacterium alkaliphilum TaxID=1428684 RepID=UPI001BA6ABA7|nr:methyltransferase domain-containing protein [Exiguobacterium alkaliphilum]QUE87977.1 class I SAM-dependent methyltransferase [Exiguobacterium alkaliphilum]